MAARQQPRPTISQPATSVPSLSAAPSLIRPRVLAAERRRVTRPGRGGASSRRAARSRFGAGWREVASAWRASRSRSASSTTRAGASISVERWSESEPPNAPRRALATTSSPTRSAATTPLGREPWHGTGCKRESPRAQAPFLQGSATRRRSRPSSRSARGGGSRRAESRLAGRRSGLARPRLPAPARPRARGCRARARRVVPHRPSHGHCHRPAGPRRLAYGTPSTSCRALQSASSRPRGGSCRLRGRRNRKRDDRSRHRIRRAGTANAVCDPCRLSSSST